MSEQEMLEYTVTNLKYYCNFYAGYGRDHYEKRPFNMNEIFRRVKSIKDTLIKTMNAL
jgi:hypothetical protein